MVDLHIGYLQIRNTMVYVQRSYLQRSYLRTMLNKKRPTIKNLLLCSNVFTYYAPFMGENNCNHTYAIVHLSKKTIQK